MQFTTGNIFHVSSWSVTKYSFPALAKRWRLQRVLSANQQYCNAFVYQNTLAISVVRAWTSNKSFVHELFCRLISPVAHCLDAGLRDTACGTLGRRRQTDFIRVRLDNGRVKLLIMIKVITPVTSSVLRTKRLAVCDQSFPCLM